MDLFLTPTEALRLQNLFGDPGWMGPGWVCGVNSLLHVSGVCSFGLGIGRHSLGEVSRCQLTLRDISGSFAQGPFPSIVQEAASCWNVDHLMPYHFARARVTKHSVGPGALWPFLQLCETAFVLRRSTMTNWRSSQTRA